MADGQMTPADFAALAGNDHDHGNGFVYSAGPSPYCQCGQCCAA